MFRTFHTFFAAAILLMAACDRSEPTPDELRCRELAGSRAAAEYDGVRIMVGSHVADSRITAGHVARCEGAAARIFVAVERARRRLPAGLRRPFDVHLDPSGDQRPDGVETLIEVGAILVDGRRGAGLDESIWVHEFAHVAAAGSRPSDPIGGGIIAAVDEAAADYAAAAILGRSAIGPRTGPGGRDLTAPPSLSPTAFHTLALGTAFDAHAVALPLAGAFYDREPRLGPLLEDLLAALHRGGVPWPAGTGVKEAIETLLDGCPRRSRQILRETINNWLPAELHP